MPSQRRERFDAACDTPPKVKSTTAVDVPADFSKMQFLAAGSFTAAPWESSETRVGVSRRRRLAIAVRSIGRDPHSAHLLPQDGYSRARNVCGLLDAGVVDLSHERLGPRESCHAHLCARRSLSSGHQHRGVIDVTTQLQRSLTPQRVRGLTNSPRLVHP